ncbi:MAG TPA: DJ-1 family glyoxalase III [Gammaproteobacteria bacterium]|nr:DJ-1 family glyoxalase III [Gammaproteobacteria bacterium]
MFRSKAGTGANKTLRALVPLAEGFEESEAVIVIDLFRRANIQVVIAGLSAGSVMGGHGIAVVPDASLHAVADQHFELVVLPGGQPGADNLAADPQLAALLRSALAKGALVGAICAGPLVLARAGLLSGRRVTSFPGALDDIEPADWHFRTRPVVVDGNLVTSRGPGTAIEFALTLIALAAGPQRRRSVEGRLMRMSIFKAKRPS